jgi:hypothetical protein
VIEPRNKETMVSTRSKCLEAEKILQQTLYCDEVLPVSPILSLKRPPTNQISPSSPKKAKMCQGSFGRVTFDCSNTLAFKQPIEKG